MLPAASRLARDAMARDQRTEPSRPRRTAALLRALAQRVDVPRAARSG
jgi:hypothetical protein